jgi:asparagine synthase (glutamine-hydrolysing)
MCGICGILSYKNEIVDHVALGSMLGTIRHRGPDASGMHVRGPVGLGHARLSIIDLSGGGQPMHNRERSLSITFNGEIFNYIELREELIGKGHHFETSSDTEVILHLYEEEGQECVKRLNGQWAFAIWDAREEELFLSRDRLGVRPLFYTEAAHSFLFASEVKALFAHPEVSRQLDVQALNQVFTFWHTLPPRTAFRGILELPPGHSMTVKMGSIRINSYWQLGFPESVASSTSTADRDQEYVERLGELLIDAARIRLRADVPVGAYLSGGLDSSLITAIVKRFTNSRLKTFSVAFEDPEYDESFYQRQVVSHLDTDHHEVRCTHNDIGRVFPDVIWHAEKPLLRNAAAPMFLLSRLVRESGFKVVLTGEGADELFGGYDIFKETKIRSFWGVQPDSKLRPLLLRRLYPYMQEIQNQPSSYLKMFFRIRPDELRSPLFSHLPRWDMTSRIGMFFSDEVKAEIKGCQPYKELEGELPAAYKSWDSFSRAQYLEAAYLLPGYILSSQGDRVAMAHAVEGRFPFLDYRVAEFASSLPPTLKMRGLDEKYLLKRFAATLLPADVLCRPKQPYRAPGVKSFVDPDNGQARFDYVDDLLSSDRLRQYGVFNPHAVQMLVSRLKEGRATSVRDGMAFTGVLSTQLLIHQFITNFTKRTDHGANSEENTCVYR